MKRFTPVFVAALAIASSFVAPVLLGADSGSAKQDRTAPEDSVAREWSELKALGQVEKRARPAAVDAASAEKARKQFVADLVRDADKLRGFYEKHPEHAEAKEAKRLEALLLVHAWSEGDSSREDRRQKLVRELRKDTSIAPAKRAEVAAFADHLAVEKRGELSRPDKLLAYEHVIRGLNSEFPAVPDGYAALIRIAKDSADTKAKALAQEVAGTPAAPAWVRAEARILVERYKLVGRSLAEIASPVLGAGNPAERAQGKPTIVYAWATFAPGSLALAKDIAAQAPAGTAIIGLNLDGPDLAPAKALAEKEKLPGEHVYDWLGRNGEWAQAIKLTDPGVAYLVGKDGVIRSVSAQLDLARALASLSTL